MRVTFLNQTLGIGGAETYFVNLFEWLSKNSVVFTIYSTNTRFLHMLAVHQLKKIPIVVDLIGDWKGLFKGLILLPIAIVYYGWVVLKTKSTTDLIVLAGFIEKILGSLWARVFNIPVVWIEFGPYGDILGPFQKWLYLLVVKIPIKVIVPTQNTRNWLIKNLEIDPQKIIIIPCGMVDPKLAKTSPKFDACCVSRLETGKGQDLLLEAWAQAIKRLPQAKLQIVGEGDQYQNLKFEIKNLKLDKNVELTGWVKNSLASIADAKIFCFPTQWPLEGFGMVAIEAAALGKPVVGFNFGPLPEIVINGQTGILVENGNIKALSEAIIKALHDRKFGPVARKRFLENYVMDVVGPKYLQIFRSCISKI